MLAKETYIIVENFLEDIIDNHWMSENSKLVLLGGIMLNIDGERPMDMFLPMRFEVRSKNGDTDDLMAVFTDSPNTDDVPKVEYKQSFNTEVNI